MNNLNPADDIVVEGEVFWAGNRISTGCPSCEQTFLIFSQDSGKIICPVCGQSKLSPQPIRIPVKNPELLLSFNNRISPEKIFQDFCQGIWFKPEDMDTQILNARVVCVFWPMYLIDSTVIGEWSGEAGFNYQVQSSQEYYRNGRWETLTRMENRQKWQERMGKVDRSYSNVCVPAISKHTLLTGSIGETSLENTAGFAVYLLNNALLWVPDLLPVETWKFAEPSLNHLVEEDCKLAAKADYFRNFQLQAKFERQNYTVILMPMYSTYYIDDDGKRHIVMINGQTGKVAGNRLSSPKRGWRIALILGLTALIVLGLGLISFLIGSIFPPVGIIGLLFIGASVLIFLAATIPAIYPWQWNSNQKVDKFTTIPGDGK